MKLSELNPILSGGRELILICPICKNKFSIRVNYHGDPVAPATWGLKHPFGIFDWDHVTLTPSIANHPCARDRDKCNAHFTVTDGNVVIS